MFRCLTLNIFRDATRGSHMYGQLCLVLGALLFVNADELVIDSEYQCGKNYQLDVVESVTIKYRGGLSDGYSCDIGFTIDSVSEHLICVQPTMLDLDCGTEIQYQEHFVSNFINDGLLTCDMNRQSSYDEHCPDYTSKFFIVIKKESKQGTSGDYATVRVFAKAETTLTTIIATAIVVPAVLLIIFVTVCICCLRRRQKRQSTNAQVTYTTAVGTATIQPGGAVQYPNTAYPPAPGNQQTSFPGNTIQQSTDGYYVHPTVTAYPVQNPQGAPGPYNYPPPGPQAQSGGMPDTSAFAPSAPPQDKTSVPPPSYDSLYRE